MRFLVAALTAAVALAPGWARAGKLATAVVPLDDKLDTRAAASHEALRKLAAKDPRVDFVDVGALARGDETDERGHLAEQAAEQFNAGLKAFDEIEFPAALEAFGRAIDLYEASDLGQHLPQLLDTMAMRALTSFTAGQADDAKAQLMRVFIVKPDYLVDPKRVTPELQGVIDAAHAALRGTEQASLRVLSAPVAGVVTVDGVERGVSPLLIPRLPTGDHFIAVRAPGFRLAQKKVRVAPGGVLEVKLEQSEAGRVLRARFEDLKVGLREGGASGTGAALARWAGADHALVFGLGEREEIPFLVGALVSKKGEVLGSETRAFTGDAQDTLEDMTRFLITKLSADEVGGGVARGAEKDTPLFTRKNLGYGALALGGVTAIGAAVMGIRASGQIQDARRIPQVDVPAFNTAISAAHSSAVTADVLGVVSVASLGTAVWLLILQDDALPPAKPQASLVPLQGGAALVFGGPLR